LGYLASGVLFGGLLSLVCFAYWKTALSRTLLFWAAFILTRPLGAVIGDLLDKPHDEGGLALGRFAASGVLLLALAVGVRVFPQRPARAAH